MKFGLLAVALGCACCRSIETRSVSTTPPPAIRVGERARAWEVRRGEERLGRIIQFQEPGQAGKTVFVVRNAWNQDLGLIDGLGRAYRYVPHLEEPAWVGSGTIMLGAERILGAEGCMLVELGAPARSVGLASDTTVRAGPSEPAARPSNAACADDGLPQSH